MHRSFALSWPGGANDMMFTITTEDRSVLNDGVS
jgi:hypothetical protein